jgi:hypothetical protein
MRAVCLSVAVLLTGCSDDAAPQALELVLTSVDALPEGTRLSFTARATGGGTAPVFPAIEADVAIDGDRTFEHELAFDAAGDYAVHVIAAGEPLAAATRCVRVDGRTRLEVLLGPVEEADGDGWGLEPSCAGAGCRTGCAQELVDCDDDDPDLHPLALEACGDHVDQDCDGADLACVDDDGDGISACAPGFEAAGVCDCDDTDPAITPSVPETEDDCENSVDEDCNGRDLVCDRDGDGFRACTEGARGCDCDDEDPSVHPMAPETECDGRDNDCDGAVDEQCAGG